MCDVLGPISRPLGVTHAGIGFFDLNDTTKQFVYQYNTWQHDYNFSVLDFFRPRAVMNETTKLYDFIWDLKVEIYVEDTPAIGECLWESQATVADAVRGDILNDWSHNYAQWYNDTYQWYQIFELWYSDNYEVFNNLTINHCHQFVWWGMQNLQNVYGVVFRNTTTTRLHGFFQLNRSKPEYTPRKLDPKVKEDNEYLYNYYSWFYQRAEKMTNQEFAESWFTGRYLEDMAKEKGLHTITMVDTTNQEYWLFSTDVFPYLWYEIQPDVVPGTD